jgi:putative membrane protein
VNKNTKLALIIGGTILVLVVILPTVLGAISGWGGTNWDWGMMGPGMMGFGWGWFIPILMVVFWGLVVWGIVALVRGLGGCCVPAQRDDTESALDILRKRYAKGEINREEFEAKKKELA